ncbi:MAG: NAD-dependent epimerase/dehydratase family protein [Sulfobacillus sp.]
MKILVTGATGFLGTALCRALEQQGHDIVRVHSRNCDLTESRSLYEMHHLVYDQIYHLAAWTQAGDFCLHHPGEQWIINQKINTHVLAWWQSAQPQAKLICMGTSCAYAPEAPLIEDNYLVGLPIDSLFSYAMTKRMLYVGLRALHSQFGMKYLCLVPSTLYGRGYHTDGRQMHFIFDLIRKILRGKRYGETVVLWGDGHQTRELVYVADFVRIAMYLAGTVDNELVNVGAGQEFTIRDFARMICAQVGYDPSTIHFDESRYVGARSKCLDIGRLMSLMPDLAFTTLEDGLSDTVSWFAEHGPL